MSTKKGMTMIVEPADGGDGSPDFILASSIRCKFCGIDLEAIEISLGQACDKCRIEALSQGSQIL